MRILILEDDVARTKNFMELFHSHMLDITENAYDAIDLLEEKMYDVVFLDHDLGEGNGSGSLVAAFMSQMNYLCEVIIHSWNVPAARAMHGYLPHAKRAPYNTESFHEVVRTI